jgi:hypothetical protein
MFSNLVTDEDPGRKLPRELRPLVEAIFGTSLDEVRIHVGERPEAIGARAFATGLDIFFAPGVYDPQSPDGLRILGHELAHVVQQLSGRVPVNGRIEVVQDAVLEEEADAVGSALAAAFQSGQHPRLPMLAAPTFRAPVHGRAIQCIMDFEAFKAATRAAGARNRIVPVDDAVKRYNQLFKAKPTDWDALLAQSKVIIAACNKYTQQRTNSGRQAGVDLLMRQIAPEEAILSYMAGYGALTSIDQKWERIEKAHEAFLKLRDKLAPKVAGVIHMQDIVPGEMTDMLSKVEKSPVSTAIVLSDIEELKRIAGTDETPDVLSSVILEATAAQNTLQLDYGFNTPSAKYNVTRGAKKKYTLNHLLLQQEGIKFRLGSLLHELTHVAVAECFGNSIIMLACPPNATDDEMMQIVKVRKAGVLNLIGQIEKAPLAQPGGSADINALTEIQKKNLTDKLNYVLDSNQTEKYLSLLKNFGQVKGIEKQVVDKQVAMADRVKSLKGKGMRNELTEYDPVINQTMLWCHLWRLDPNNATYATIRNLARIASTYRQSAAGRRKQIVSPLTQIAVDRNKGRRMSIG